MANFKRKKTKRNVRCTICTSYRWMGNKLDKQKPKYRRTRKNVDLSNLHET